MQYHGADGLTGRERSEDEIERESRPGDELLVNVGGAEGLDITEKKVLEREIARQREELARLDELKSRFFANISHEFRRPLTSLMDPLKDALAHRDGLSAAPREQLELAHRNCARLLELVDTLPDFSRLEADRMQPSERTSEVIADRPPARRGKGRAQRILLADGDADMRTYLRQLLLQNGYEVEAVADGVSALNAARERKPDLVLADVLMPGLDGLALLRELRGDASLAAVPAIVLSTHASDKAQAEATHAGADDYLIKPFSARELLPRIESHLRMARFRHEIAEAEEAFARLSAESEQRRRLYETILSSTPDFVYTFDLNHRFTYANESLLTMWGKTAGEAIGKNCLELGYEPWHAAMHDVEIEQVIATKQPIRGGVPFSGTHGRRIYDYLFVPVFNAGGEVEAIAGTTRDVTERKLAEERIRASEERLRFMAESMPQKILTAKQNGEMDYFNRQWMQFTGLAFEEIEGWKWVEIIHPDDAAETLRLWRRSIDSGEPFQFIHRFRRSDSAYRWHLSRIQSMRNEDGKVMMWIGSSTEIHEQKNTEDELRRANQDLEQFAYAASHDLQEPLRGIKIYSQLLERRYRSSLDGQGLEFLRHLTNGASRMEMLVHDLLVYTRVIQAEKPSERVDAAAALSVALDNLSGAIGESGARVTYDALPALNIHFTQLQQLFQNLVGNAIKYHRPDIAPVIHVSAKREAERWVLTVADNGIGIEPKYTALIFGLFKRLHTADEYSGTGIGLALCQRIVERNHGTIWVECEPGKGSRFSFALPA